MTFVPLVLLASARPTGDTAAFVQTVFAATESVCINLLDAPLASYSYTGHYPPDDSFPDIIGQLLEHEVIVMATPVYWYTMSGLLKTFFDRLTDLVTIAKPLGRRLRGKRLFLLVVGTDTALPPGFETPFRLTADYFGMSFGDTLYRSSQSPPPAEVVAQSVSDFLAALAASPSPHATS
jgi:hypothetical protein